MGKSPTQDANDNKVATAQEHTTEKRQFVRIEITSPASLSRIKDIFGNYWPQGDEYRIQGNILNISAGGVLLDLEQPVNEGDIVAMRFLLRDTGTLNGILGLVKRCDTDESGNLAGVQFVTRENLNDILSASEMDLLDEQFDHFDKTVREVVNRFVAREQV
ncbi:MAG TPA: PilZ domain-containing protein [candidate division Zixibacteria bacterium]|nr:PilZ domain-containing protein [candidate division Zixibacteria bacterium]